MLNFSDFLKEIKFRFKSPLIASFIISWLVVNWEIVIGIILYGNDGLLSDGYKSKIDLVKQHNNLNSFLWNPLIIALIYVFVFPFIRYAIHFFNARVNKWGVKTTLNISKDGAVSLSKYMKLRQDYEDRTKVLIDNIEKESSFSTLNKELNDRLLKLEDDRRRLFESLNDFKEKSNINYLNGYWKLTYSDPTLSITPIEKKVSITSGAIHLAGAGENKKRIFTIIAHGFNAFSFELILIVKNDKNDVIFYQAMRPLVNENFSKLHNLDPNGIFLALDKDQ